MKRGRGYCKLDFGWVFQFFHHQIIDIGTSPVCLRWIINHVLWKIKRISLIFFSRV